ncbi:MULTISPECIES: sodium ion-translocating decarboxylase subunit beta [Pelosinus]|uniref:Sodium ion-translocating decarboxylase, beta subunit n=1 Tax=Pelosinus fermentans B4 TaxID=1149862 RepID=I9L569_9FIRM|nr:MULTISPECIES: sodium ion-translocating decarboxylase subunit beta [Pelosinus]EIW15509.1 sodium ion-translocating decarboxylase, beta subunit [Pelosinus fermentans B4]EIW26800.1 sodium ion-translocating decarboxylase, beta subunit [Pelosinus fermentans A11]OAM92254.1 sodium ion-translocating decarboxylase, beta subunit [Pelosinus fermentans DSM 17108]SDQ38493.1 oxaloacetate decarboxylase, beta subunit [Pelosinus fermentans]
MFQQILSLMGNLAEQTGLAQIWWGNIFMIFVGAILVYLALYRKYEPFLLLGIGFSCIVANVPGSDLTQPGGLFYYAYQGVELVIIPPLIFLGVGAMTDFGPMIANPSLMILGAAAHLGIFIALIGAKALGFTLAEAGAIGIIGGADGPMAIFVTMKLAPHLLPQIAVAAYSYMALMPLIQPPIMKLLTSPAERQIVMVQSRKVSRLEKICFPFVMAIIVNLLLPPVAPLITMLMLGNMLREVLLVDRLASTAANDLMNVITITLTVAVGSTMEADKFLNIKTLQIIVLGLIAFIGGTASGVIGAKIMNWFSGGKINPLIGSAGIASVPIAARVSHVVGLQENPYNFLIMHAMGPNLAGVFGTAISGGIMLALIGVK